MSVLIMSQFASFLIMSQLAGAPVGRTADAQQLVGLRPEQQRRRCNIQGHAQGQPVQGAGTQFTCFTSTKVRILTQTVAQWRIIFSGAGLGMCCIAIFVAFTSECPMLDKLSVWAAGSRSFRVCFCVLDQPSLFVLVCG